MKTEWAELYLSIIIRFYIENALKKKGWRVVAIDPQKDKVVLSRYDSELGENDE